MVINWRRYAVVKADEFNWHRFSNVDELGSGAGMPLGLRDFEYGFTEPILI
jgi:hypothetical protein